MQGCSGCRPSVRLSLRLTRKVLAVVPEEASAPAEQAPVQVLVPVLMLVQVQQPVQGPQALGLMPEVAETPRPLPSTKPAVQRTQVVVRR